MKKDTPLVEKWEKSEEFKALNDACYRSGADSRALPHFIKDVLREEKEKKAGNCKCDCYHCRMCMGRDPFKVKKSSLLKP